MQYIHLLLNVLSKESAINLKYKYFAELWYFAVIFV